MDTSENLELPYIMPNQAQKHVTHNEAIRQLDALVQISIISRSLSQPPDSVDFGARYIIPANATGEWVGKSYYIAAYQDGAWAYYTPQEGWIAWDREDASLLVFRDNTWRNIQTSVTEIDQLPVLGVNTSASEASRFGVATNDSFFSHEGNSHRLSVNKASENDTGAIIFKSDWTGHAEIGLAGNNNFSVKVTSDGISWADSIVVAADSGKVSFPSGLQNAPLSGVPEVLNGVDVLYLDAVSGDDANDGKTVSGAIQSLQRLEEILPIGRRVQLRLLSDIEWDYVIRMTYPVALLEIYGRNADNTAYENRNISVKNSTNIGSFCGGFLMSCISNVYIRNLNITLDTAKSTSFLNYNATMGYLRSFQINLSKSGSGACCLYGDSNSFVASRHQQLSIDDTAKGHVAHGISADENPNDDWRYATNMTAF